MSVEIVGPVNRISTNLGFLDVMEGGLKSVEGVEGKAERQLRETTLAKLAG